VYKGSGVLGQNHDSRESKVRGKVVPLHAITAYGRVKVQVHRILTSAVDAVDGGKWLDLRPGRFHPEESAPRTCQIGGYRNRMINGR
jgi:hypothetical protein